MEHTIIAECYAMQNTNEIISQYEIIKENNILSVDANEKLDLLWVEIDKIQEIIKENNLLQVDSGKMQEIEEKLNEVSLLKNDVLKYGQISRIAYDRILCAKTLIEKLKIPEFIEQANKFLSVGKSVVIYVQFAKTLDILAKELNIDCVIYGKKTIKQIGKAIDDFQSDKSRIIICTIKYADAGGFVLNDINGKFPRASISSKIISKQVLGRICRAGSKTGTEQIIMFCKDSPEEKMHEKMKKSLD